MYLHIGRNVTVDSRRIIGVFDMDNTTTSRHTRRFLQQAEQEGQVITCCDDLPRSFLLCDHPYHRQIVYLSELTPTTLQKRSNK